MVVAIYDPVTSILTPITGSVAIDGTTNIVPIPIATQVGLAPGQTYEIRFYFYNCTTTIGGAANSCAIDNPRFSSMANEPPTAINDSFATPYLTAVSGNVTAANPTTADSDPESQTLRVDQISGAAFTVGTPIALANGSLTITNANGAFTFTPNANFSGTQTFTYRINDGFGGTSTATVTITVYGPLILAKTWVNGGSGHTISVTAGAATVTATAPTNATGTPVAVTPGATITLPAETFGGGATAAMYNVTVACSGGSTLASGAVGDR